MAKGGFKGIIMALLFISGYALLVSIVYIYMTKEIIGFICLLTSFLMLAMITMKILIENKKVEKERTEENNELGYYSPGSIQPLLFGLAIATMALLFVFNIWFFICNIPIFLFFLKNFFKEAKH
jgi:protein-S-isoprenylcysteine O-methyltransferase Ste14